MPFRLLRRRRRATMRNRRILVPIALVAASITALTPSQPTGAARLSSGTAARDTSPVDLATPVKMGNGVAHQSAIVRAGDARIEVLSPTLLRLEYSATGNFENSPTINALDRRLPVPPYRAYVSGGWLTVRTSRAVLRYRVGSGPFTPLNTSLQFSLDGHTTTVQPTWEWECTFDQVCQAGAASLAGGASLGQSSSGYVSTAGYIGNLLTPGSRATWQVLGAPVGHGRAHPAVLDLPRAAQPASGPQLRSAGGRQTGRHARRLRSRLRPTSGRTDDHGSPASGDQCGGNPVRGGRGM